MWTRFMDMHSGGSCKESPYQYIFIEAPEDEAKVIFYNRFGHNPERVTCTCCGEDYSIKQEDDLAQATGYYRNCEWSDKEERYLEQQKVSSMEIRRSCGTADDNPWGLYQTLDQFRQNKDVLFIGASEIKPEERVGEVPRQGYVWVGANV